eukprot:gene11744-15716_t
MEIATTHISDSLVATVVDGHTFTISKRYSVTESVILGKGSYGVVCNAQDTSNNLEIAIKRIRPFAADAWDARRTIREIKLMKLLGAHPNVITLFDLSLNKKKEELYMMMELMDSDLHQIIKSKQVLSERHHKCFMKQILEGVSAMHSIGVFHRDLKPGNILVTKDCHVRIADFGLARMMDESTLQGNNELHPMTEYVVTRWYRAPEVLLAPKTPYSAAVDIWATGCIFAELLRGKALFPGKNHFEQISMILELMGYSGPENIGIVINDETAEFLDKRCKFEKLPMNEVFPNASREILHLLESMFTINPNHRPSAIEALAHVSLKDAEVFFDYSKNYLKPPPEDLMKFELEDFSLEDLDKIICDEVASFATPATRICSPTTTNATESATVSPYREDRGYDKTPASYTSSNAPTGKGRFNTSNYDMDGSDGPPSQAPTDSRRVRKERNDNNPFAKTNSNRNSKSRGSFEHTKSDDPNQNLRKYSIASTCEDQSVDDNITDIQEHIKQLNCNSPDEPEFAQKTQSTEQKTVHDSTIRSDPVSTSYDQYNIQGVQSYHEPKTKVWHSSSVNDKNNRQRFSITSDLDLSFGGRSDTSDVSRISSTEKGHEEEKRYPTKRRTSWVMNQLQKAFNTSVSDKRSTGPI